MPMLVLVAFLAAPLSRKVGISDAALEIRNEIHLDRRGE